MSWHEFYLSVLCFGAVLLVWHAFAGQHWWSLACYVAGVVLTCLTLSTWPLTNQTPQEGGVEVQVGWNRELPHHWLLQTSGSASRGRICLTYQDRSEAEKTIEAIRKLCHDGDTRRLREELERLPSADD